MTGYNINRDEENKNGSEHCDCGEPIEVSHGVFRANRCEHHRRQKFTLSKQSQDAETNQGEQ